MTTEMRVSAKQQTPFSVGHITFKILVNRKHTPALLTKRSK